MLDFFFPILSSLSRVRPPEPLGGSESAEVVRRLYTPEMKEAGIKGSVRVVLSVDENGRVTKACATRLPRVPFLKAEPDVPILIDEATGDRLPPPPPYTDHPQLWRIAEEAARAQRFRPAMRGEEPVRYRGYVCSYGFEP